MLQTHRAVDALTKCENDANVIHAVARLFWKDQKIAKARKWMNRSVTLDPSLGDAWASFLAFEIEHGGEKECIDVINRCALAQPNRGQIVWMLTLVYAASLPELLLHPYTPKLMVISTVPRLVITC